MRSPGWVRLGLAAASGCLAVAAAPWLWRAELATFDLRQRWLPADLPARARVLIVAIDDESLRVGAAELQRFPWPRWAYARIIQALALARPAAIGLDLLLPEPGPGDEELVAVAAETGTLLACNAGRGGAPGGVFLEGVLPAAAPRWGVLQAPAPAFAGLPVAMARVEAEEDGVTRRVALVANNGGKALASFPLALAVRAGAGIELEREGVRSQGRSVTGRDGWLWPRFVGGVGAFRYRSAWELLRGWQLLAENAPLSEALPFASEIEGAVVIVTVTATSLFELRTVPTAAVYPGGELLATAVASLLDGRAVRRPGGWAVAGSTLAAALLLGALAVPIRRPAGLVALWAGTVLAWGGAALALWARADVWLPVAGPGAALVAALAAVLGEGWWREGRERRRVEAIFAHYVAPDVLKLLLEHPEGVRLGGERRRLAVLFSDIRSYTTLSEKLPPEAVVSWLNEYFAAQVGVILAHRGTIDKFIGDAVMAFWGAPLPQPDQERLAARCAAEMVRTAQTMAQDWQRRGGPPLAIGVGVATGEAVVGNVGAPELCSYTAIGDTVNLASRLEGKTKELGVPVVLDEATARGSGLAVRDVGEITVKGRAAAVRVFALAELDAMLEKPSGTKQQ